MVSMWIPTSEKHPRSFLKNFRISRDYFNLMEEACQFKFMWQELRPGAYCALLGRSVPSFQSLRPTQHICKHHDSWFPCAKSSQQTTLNRSFTLSMTMSSLVLPRPSTLTAITLALTLLKRKSSPSSSGGPSLGLTAWACRAWTWPMVTSLKYARGPLYFPYIHAPHVSQVLTQWFVIKENRVCDHQIQEWFIWFITTLN